MSTTTTSPFKKLTPRKEVGPYDRERIDGEIAHLLKRGSVRHADGRGRGLRAVWPAVLTLLAVVGLFLMDPVVHALRKNEAVRLYLYLHHYGSDAKAADIAHAGLFSTREVELLDARQGSFQGYYPSPVSADKTADAIIAYTKGVTFLHSGAYDRLDMLGKLRYQLFIRWGLQTPVSWGFLDQPVRD